jgi:hypothetical protein
MAYEDLMADAALVFNVQLQDNAATTTIIDDGPNTFAAVLQGGDNTNAKDVAGNDWFASALQMNGTDDRVYIPIGTQLRNKAAVTIAGWINRATVVNAMLGNAATGGTTRLGIFWNTANIYAVADNAVGILGYLANTDTGWHHVAMVFDGSLTGWDRLKLYYDGVLQTFTTTNNTPATLTTDSADSETFYIGWFYNEYSASIHGPTQAWTKALTPTEIGYLITGPAGADVTAPTVSSATIAANGTTLTVVFDEAVTGDGTGFEIDNGSALTATYVSGDGTATWMFTLSGTVLDADTPVLTYDSGVGDMADLAANALADIASGAVTNNSTQVLDVTAPTLSSVTVTGATTLTLVFDEAVNVTTATGLTIAASGAAVTVSSPAGTGTSTLTFTLSRSIASTESLSFSYDSGTGDIEDLAGNALATISNRLATNNVSAVAGSGISRSRLVNQGG